MANRFPNPIGVTDTHREFPLPRYSLEVKELIVDGIFSL